MEGHPIPGDRGDVRALRLDLAAHCVLAPLSALVAVLLVANGARAWQVAATLLAAVALHAAVEVSRRRPAAGFAVASAAMLGLVLTPAPGWESSALPSSACFLLALWRCAFAGGRRLRLAALLVGATGVAVTGLLSWIRLEDSVPAWTPLLQGAFALAAVVGVWAAAVAAARRRERAARAERARLAAAVSTERAHIRRDLHDVIAHSITVMVARIDAASVTASDAGARRELEDVAESGRDALGALRAMLAVLDAERPDGDGPPLTVAALPGLAEAASTSLHRVTFEEVGERRPLAIGAEPALVRVAQEGITNALRHLRPPVAVEVRLEWRETYVLLEVGDDGGGGVLHGGAAGSGLAGARERAEAAGGTLTVVRDGGGWRLAARLPTKGSP
ncbi:sensor histidine kinase [Nocardiopsis potens]|uniref:sensor histidine kinase n=1 Tax=Nocardiopsis potens TaxID=1246458 RepID=UPI000593C4F0|nr:histidine kinase [Nocardiopsis potens]